MSGVEWGKKKGEEGSENRGEGLAWEYANLVRS